MGLLGKYIEKRNFNETLEPKGGKADNEKLRFVIQKHDASRLHYDFRLEMEGVLKSWAVPKGPSTDPKVKRLAMMVEDHPYDYRDFEGIIPSGYGAGTVIVWDEGFYEPIDVGSKDKIVLTKNLMAGLKKGKIDIKMYGKKVQGEFSLIKVHGRGEKGWLLFKVKDDFASTDDITLKDKSVISNKTLAQIEKTSTNIYGSKKPKEPALAKLEKAQLKLKSKKSGEVTLKIKTLNAGAKKASIKKTATEKNASKKINDKKIKTSLKQTLKKKPPEIDISSILKKAKNLKIPIKVSPMLATLVDVPFDYKGWIYEIKWDGYRALGFTNKGTADVKSRNDKSFSDKFYPVKDALKKWNINSIVDGEIVVVDENGIPDFGDLQNWRSEADGELLYYIFDLLWYEGKDTTSLPLLERKQILKKILPAEGVLRYSENFEQSGTEFFEAAKQMGLEGIIAKQADSKYRAGARSDDWLKIKANKRQEVVIGGYTINDDTSKPFSALLAGVYDNGKLNYIGKIGTGFSVKTQKEMLAQFKPLITSKTPFTTQPDIKNPSGFRRDPPHATAVWLKPSLVCEVAFTEMTSDNIMRHPSFQGMRTDKNSSDVNLDKEIKTTVKNKIIIDKKLIVTAGKQSRKTFLNPTDETQFRKINGHGMKFTNLSKFYWTKEKITKRDLLNYYYQIAPYILPYLVNRPQSMSRFPDGIDGQHFYFKNVTGKAPDWAETFLYTSSSEDRDRKYLVAKDDASLLYMVSLGCIEMNPWHSRVESEDYPDWCVIDLDPWKNSFDKVIEAALVTKEILDAMKVASYSKTSGSTGIHIYIPLGAKYTHKQSKEFARVIATLVHQRLPKFTSIERSVKERSGKMYIDFLQNRAQATISAPYSVRPKPGATVSMPLHWHEVKKGLKMSDFNIHNALDRVKNQGDLFKPVLGKGIDMEKAIQSFSKEN